MALTWDVPVLFLFADEKADSMQSRRSTKGTEASVGGFWRERPDRNVSGGARSRRSKRSAPDQPPEEPCDPRQNLRYSGRLFEGLINDFRLRLDDVFVGSFLTKHPLLPIRF